MPGYFIGNEKRNKWYFGGVKIGQGYFNGELVYQSAFMVTYCVDTANVYSEQVIPGESLLHPKTFVPEKTDWTFVGWRLDKSADSNVETNLKATEPITLYAVFKQTITCTFKSNNNTDMVSGTRYYNNGNAANVDVVVPNGASYTGWTWMGWSAAGVTSANASVSYANGAMIKDVSESSTFYGLYEQTITCTFKSYNKSENADGIRYHNAYGNTTKASVKVPTGTSYSGWTWRGWSAANSTGASGSVAHSNGSTITDLTSGYTYYGLYQRTLTLSYDGNGSNSGSTASQTNPQYWSASGNYSNPKFTLRSNGFSKTNCTFQKWAMGSTGGTQYAAGGEVTLTASTKFYAVWKTVAVSNKLLGSGNGGIQSEWTYSVDTTNYTNITVRLRVKSVYAYFGIGIGGDYDTASGKVTGTADDYDTGTWDYVDLKLPANSGKVSISFGISPSGGYGGSDENTSWELILLNAS